MSSINFSELEKFSKSEKEWWDPNGEFKTLHQINPVRLEYITTIIDKYIGQDYADLKLLDIGCGGGLISAPMSRLGFDVTAIDANDSNVRSVEDYAKSHKLKIKALNNSAESHCQSGNKYNVILCLEVVEHVNNVAEFLANIEEMLLPGGVLIMSTINRTHKAYGLAILMAEYVLRWLPRGTHDYNKFQKPSELVGKLPANTKMDLKELKGLELSLFKNKWQLTDNIDVNYFATFVKRK